MIPAAYITAWRRTAPWNLDAQIEQDLVISRAIIELFSVQKLAKSFLFRGGTALYKLHLSLPARYSEDIDLVQIRQESIGETLDLIKTVLNPWLGEPNRQFKRGRTNLVYRFLSEDRPPLKLRLKIEINTREHFTVKPVVNLPFSVRNPWFSGLVSVSTYSLDELLSTKMRALYQRRKGRDLFDIWFALKSGQVNIGNLISCFHHYMREEGHTVTRAQFEKNLDEKRREPDFRDDVYPLLHPAIEWNFDQAMNDILHTLISKLSGNPWKG